jgi:hypothetical protein
MSRVDTTSFANSLLGGMQFGAQVAGQRQVRDFREQQAALSQALAERDFNAQQVYRNAGIANMEADNARQDQRFQWDMAQAKQEAKALLARKAADARLLMGLSSPTSPGGPDAAEVMDPNDLNNASPHIQEAWLKRSMNSRADAEDRQKAMESIEAAKKAKVLKHALDVPNGLIKDVERFGLWNMIGPNDMPMSVAQQRDAENEQLRSAMIYDMGIEETPDGQTVSNVEVIQQLSQMPLPMVQMYYKAHQEQKVQAQKMRVKQEMDKRVMDALVRAKGMTPQQAEDTVTLDERFPQSTGTGGQTQRTQLAAANVAIEGAKRDADRASREYESIAKMLRDDPKNDTPPSEDELAAASDPKGDKKKKQIVEAWQRYQNALGKERDARSKAQSTAEVPASGSADDATKTDIDNILDILSP